MFLGVPLILLPEEVVLLVRKQFAVLVHDSQAHRPPTKVGLEKWNADRPSSVATQLSMSESKDSKDKFASKAMTEEAIRKRKAREEQRAAAARAKALAENTLSEVPQVIARDIIFAPSPSSQEYQQSPNLSTANYTVNVPASSPASLDWYSAEGCTYETIEAAQQANIWSYPSNLHGRAKCGVFQDLWEKGYYMGVGVKFGGDFLVYPGDPLRYHSHFVATVIDSPGSTINPMEVVAHGRLGTATKKAHLLCGWYDETQEVTYFSIEWSGFG